MHEMGIALQIVKIAIDSIPPDMKDCNVTAVTVEIGALSSIVPDSLSFCFEVASKETPCSEAELIITKVPTVMKCNDCGHEWHIEETVFQCSKCQGIRIQIIKDTDIDIISLTID